MRRPEFFIFMTACAPESPDMVVADNTYSRLVAWLKILFPLIALAILSTLFLVARTVDPAQDLPYADVDVAELAREQRIGQPNYSGVTADGAAISLSARSALPDADNPRRITGTDVNADIRRFQRAVYTLADDIIVMYQNVLVTQGATALSADKLTYNLDTGDGFMEGRVKTVLQQANN